MRSRILAVMTGRIARLGLGNHPGLLFRPGYEGYCDYAFGGRAGPAVGVEHLFHEFAHAAEFGPETFRRRASIYGFRFHIPQQWIFDRYCPEPVTMQATARELRTFAYEYHFLRMAGYRLDPAKWAEKCARVMVFMHDWYCVPGKGEEGRHAYCVGQILEHIDRLDPKDALGRLIGWLDITARRLERIRRSRSEKVKQLKLQARRYRADGTIYAY